MRAKVQLLLALIMSCCSVWAQAPTNWDDVSSTNSNSITANPAPNDIGGENNPYEINDADDLKKLASIVNNTNGFPRNTLRGVHFKLTTDIDLANEPWTPIGNYDGDLGWSFSGSLDGNGYSIYNLNLSSYIGGSSYYFAGLFGLASHSTIKNLGIHGEANITSVDNNLRVGLLVGTFEGGTIENCYAIGSVTFNGSTHTGQHVGLLAGYSPEKGSSISTIRNCYAVGSISFNANSTNATYVGGLVGRNRQSVIENCYADVKITTTGTPAAVGSLLGYTESNTTSRPYNVKDSYGTIGASASGSHGTINVFPINDIDNKLGNLPPSAWKNTGIPGHYPYLAGAFENSGNLVEAELNFNGGLMTVDTSLGGTVSVKTNNGNSITLPVVADITAPTGGYTGQGWFTGNAPSYTSFTGTEVTSSVTGTLTARYSADATLHYHNGTNYTSLPAQTIYYNEEPTLPTTIPAGYTLAEWNTMANYTGTAYTTGAFTADISGGNLYAKYTGSIALHYYNGTTYGEHQASFGIVYNETPIPALPTNSPTGYTFEGWYLTENYAGTAYTTGAFTADISGGNLYAKYTKNVALHYYDGTDYDEHDSSFEIVYNKIPTFPLDVEVPTGYTLAEWNTMANYAGTTYTTGAFTADISGGNLYAKYTGSIALHYYTGSLYLERSFGELLDVVYNEPLPALPNLTINKPAGYNDGTWSLGDIGGTTYSPVIMTADPTNYELWANYTATIALDANNGVLASGVTSPITITYNTPLAFNDPTKNQHSFEGWALNGGSTLYSMGSNFTELLGASPTLIAQWSYILPEYIVWIEPTEGITVDRATEVEHKVEEGYDFKMFVEVDEEYNNYNLTAWVNGQQIYPYRTDFFRYYFLIWDIYEDKNVVFRLTENATSNSLLDAVKISTTAGTISVDAPKATAVQIVSITGNVVFDSVVNGAAKAYVPAGIYVVVADGKSTKVIVR
jgi:Listeria-Bacteroides repeat domain (List_Bact_rpt)./The GLUG motif.